MPEHRERVDKRTSAEINRRVMIPLLADLGARYLAQALPRRLPGRREEHQVGSRPPPQEGPPEHGRRTKASTTATAPMTEGPTRSIEVDRRVVWSVKHDNRLVQNDETRASKVVTFDESFNKIRTFSSFDLMTRFSASAKGEVLGIGGSVTNTTEARAHS